MYLYLMSVAIVFFLIISQYSIMGCRKAQSFRLLLTSFLEAMTQQSNDYCQIKEGMNQFPESVCLCHHTCWHSG